jgi:hypothetical protein
MDPFLFVVRDSEQLVLTTSLKAARLRVRARTPLDCARNG